MAEHVSVLLNEAIENLNINPNGLYVDMTLGGGGHSEVILQHLKKGHLYAFDQDEYALKQAKIKLANYKNITYINSNFEHAKSVLEEMGIEKVDGILFDLGVSSFQFDLPERGFSYNYDSPLDMRMDQKSALSAYEIVNEYSKEEIMKILYRYGEEPFAKNITINILEARSHQTIKTTFELVEIIKKSLPGKILRKKGHPAKQTFQALRIAVNNELGVLEKALYDAVSLLNPGGRIVTITFHSLEDRICKMIFRELSTIDIPKGLPIIITEKPTLKLINKHVILPSEVEILGNNRSHSAKMRVVEKNK
ncbi:MAG: 16S rRNA (cytosine(1402)-N(4))-methyltransferase RsmH [Firmicutes bacterium]|nr:16S rRNA (cytosine(1402)-N(4))-methyltransferase RsmH [Bacillota bacterium]